MLHNSGVIKAEDGDSLEGCIQHCTENLSGVHGAAGSRVVVMIQDNDWAIALPSSGLLGALHGLGQWLDLINKGLALFPSLAQ